MSQPSVFTRIINGDLPGHFLHRDDQVVGLLTIAPIRPGHAMVVPVAQIDHWVDLSPEIWARVGEVSQLLAEAQMKVFEPTRIGSMILGMEVPHAHVHLVPIDHESDLSFANADASASQDDLLEVAKAIRAELRSGVDSEFVPPD